MKARFFSTLILWVSVISLLYFTGADGTIWFIAIMSGLTQYELYGLWQKSGLAPMTLFACLLGSASLLATHHFYALGAFDSGLAALGLSAVLVCLPLIRNPNVEFLQKTLFPTLAGLAMVPLPFYFMVSMIEFFYRIGYETTGLMLGVWIIAVAKFADVGGLLVGKRFGRTKLAPTISPGKTWEGVAGGILTSMLVSVLLVLLFSSFYPPKLTPWLACVLAIPVACAGIASDLLESVFKRIAGTKDSGAIIPGIGGVYDLTDSLLLACPVAYFLFMLTL